MNLTEYSKELIVSCKRGADSLLQLYTENEIDLINGLRGFGGIKSEIFVSDYNSRIPDLIKFSSLFSDLIVINQKMSKIPSTKSHINLLDGDHKNFEKKITFPAKYYPLFDHQRFDMTTGYVNHADEDLFSFAKKYSTFINSGRLITRPSRVVWSANKYNKDWWIWYADPNTSTDHWQVSRETNNELFIDNGCSADNINILFELTLPYFQKIDIKNLDKILTEESDAISSFRAELINIVKEGSKNKTTVQDLANDTLKPKVDLINRRFKRINNHHRMIVGGGLASFLVSLCLFRGDYMNIFKLIGGSVVGGILQEVKYQNSLEKIEDQPCYLIWKIQRTS